MKTLIISDTHLTTVFDLRKYQCLRKIISKYDRLIINGDFWDRYFCTFQEFVSSKWQKLFPMMKSKKAIYITGNHDPIRLVSEKANSFCNSVCEQYFVEGEKYRFQIEHGHKIIPSPEILYPHLFDYKFIAKINTAINTVCIKIMGKRWYKIRNRVANLKCKDWTEANLKQNEFLILGHTHFQECDMRAHYANSGVINHGLLQYLVVENDAVIIFDERY